MIDSKRPADEINGMTSNGQSSNDSRPRNGAASRPKPRPPSGTPPAPPAPQDWIKHGFFIGGGEIPIRDDRYDDQLVGESNTKTSPRQATGKARKGAAVPEQEQQKLPIEQIAANLQDGPTILALRAAGLGRDLPVEAWRIFLTGFLQRAGDPADPIERLLVEQLALAHQTICRLYCRAATAEDAATSEVCFAALTRLLAEVRRLALAVREYRGPTSPQVVNMVEQQNVAVGGNQQIANLEGAVATSPGKNSITNELTSNNHPRLEHEVQQQFTVQPAAENRRETEPAETPRIDARRPRAAERSGVCHPALDESDRTSNSGG